MEERKSRYELFMEEEARKSQPTKRCSKCGEVKVLSEYYKHKRHLHGVRSVCKACSPSRGRKYKNWTDRFWKDFHKRTRQAESCIEWTGMVQDGRPVIQKNYKLVSVRRIVYKLSIGDLSDDMPVITTCRNKLCVRQLHLKALNKEEYDTLLRNTPPIGELNGSAKLTEMQVRAIRDLYETKRWTQQSLATRYGVSRSVVGSIVRREYWTHVE